MEVKKTYNVSDPAWIHGIGVKNTLTKGTVIKCLDLTNEGYSYGPFYIIEIPTHIEPLLEIRTWETMSQDENGPIGMIRGLRNMSSTIKFAKKSGFTYSSDEIDDDGPTAEQIRAALEKTSNDTKHQPLVLKENKPRSRNYNRKKKQ